MVVPQPVEVGKIRKFLKNLVATASFSTSMEISLRSCCFGKSQDQSPVPSARCSPQWSLLKSTTRDMLKSTTRNRDVSWLSKWIMIIMILQSGYTPKFIQIRYRCIMMYPDWSWSNDPTYPYISNIHWRNLPKSQSCLLVKLCLGNMSRKTGISACQDDLKDDSWWFC